MTIRLIRETPEEGISQKRLSESASYQIDSKRIGPLYRYVGVGRIHRGKMTHHRDTGRRPLSYYQRLYLIGQRESDWKHRVVQGMVTYIVEDPSPP